MSVVKSKRKQSQFMDNMQTDAPQFLITGRTQTGFSFIFIPSGTGGPYVCQWIAVF